tara:strand:- start:1520 stop:2578 length:1059 start_codon:yes stop_codon:yes gene_type:complete
LSIPSVARGVNLIASDIARCNSIEFKNRKTEAYKGDASILLDDPHPSFTRDTFIQGMVSSMIVNGNGYAHITRDGQGRPVMLTMRPSEYIQPDVNTNTGLIEYTDFERGTIAAQDMLHFRGLVRDASYWYQTGQSLMQYAKTTLTNALLEQNGYNSALKNSAAPRLKLKHPARLSEQAGQRLRQQMSNYTGQGQGRVVLLEEGCDLDILSTKVETNTEARTHTLHEIARILGIPPVLLFSSEDSKWASIEAMRAYLSQCIRPLLATIADEIHNKLQRTSESFEFDPTPILFGAADDAARLSQLVNSGILTINEARSQLALGEIEGGNELRLPLNMSNSGGAENREPELEGTE